MKFNNQNFTIPGRETIKVDRELFDNLILSVPTYEVRPLDRFQRIITSMQELIREKGNLITHDEIDTLLSVEMINIKVNAYRKFLRKATAVTIPNEEESLENV